MTGKVKLGGHTIEGATPLWCAAGAGHFDLVKFLLENGADVNHTTSTNSTPLRAACFDGHLNIVKHLVEVGKADYNIANKFNNTCFMIAAFKGHLPVVKYLLEQGVSPNVSANCGATALHFAAETGAMPIVKELTEKGVANPSLRNDQNLTPLLVAAAHCQHEVFDFLINKFGPKMPEEERIEAYELIGASFANDKENYNLDKCYDYLETAMQMREANQIAKTPTGPIPAYASHKECETMAELADIKSRPDKMHMEGLCIRERILGTQNEEVTHPVIFRGAVEADNNNFSACVALWLHAMRIKQNLSQGSVVRDVLRFSQCFSQMIRLNEDVELEKYLIVLEATEVDIGRIQACLADPAKSKDDPETLAEDLEADMKTFLYLIVILTRLNIAVSHQHLLQSAMKVLHRVVSDLRPRSILTGRTLLHMTVDSLTHVDEFHVHEVVKFPNLAAMKLLLEVGHDVQSRDKTGNTALHLIVKYKNSINDFVTLHGIIEALLNAGIHVDVVNKDGKTALALAHGSVAQIILQSKPHFSLKCLSARAVKKHSISFVGQVPEALEEFILLHGP